MLCPLFKRLALPVTFSAMLASPAVGADLFSLVTELDNGDVGDASFSSFEDIIEFQDSTGYASILNNYNETSGVVSTLNVRGLEASVSYETLGTTLFFDVPSLGISESFVGIDRDDAQDQFEEFLKNNGEGILTDLLQGFVESTPIDPVAGNPKSLMSQMVATDFSRAQTLGQSSFAGVAEGSVSNRFEIGVAAGNYSAGDFDKDIITVPIAYTVFMDDPRYQLQIDAPINFIDIEGAESYSASLGVGFRFPLTDDWGITPSVRVGGAGSEELGSIAVMYSGSLASNFDYYMGDLKLSLTNLVSQIETQSLEINDYEIDYDLSNTIFNNGVSAEGSLGFTIFEKPASWAFSIAHTYIDGDAVFLDSYIETAFSIGSRTILGSADWNDIRIGAKYTTGDDYDGFEITFGYSL